MTDALAEFIHARLDEDEQAAQEAAGAPWALEVSGMVHVSAEAQRDAKWRWGHMGYVATVEHDYDRAHIVRHDPARVIAEVEAKRRILDLHRVNGEGGADPICDVCLYAPPCETVQALALAYADHPDYQPKWKP